MEVFVEVPKIIKCTIYSTAFCFNSDGGVDEVLVVLSLIEQIFKNASFMSILFSFKLP